MHVAWSTDNLAELYAYDLSSYYVIVTIILTK